MITKQKHAGSRRAIALAAGLVWAGYGTASAQDAAAAAAPPLPPKTNVWATTAAAALTLTRGNSETFLATLSLESKAKWAKDEVELGISGGYGESTVNNVDTKNTEFVQGYGQYNRLFSDRFYGALRLEGQYDGIAGINYRFKVSPMAGYYLIKNTNMTLAVEGGPSLIDGASERPDRDAYWAARLAEQFDYKLTADHKSLGVTRVPAQSRSNGLRITCSISRPASTPPSPSTGACAWYSRTCTRANRRTAERTMTFA